MKYKKFLLIPSLMILYFFVMKNISPVVSYYRTISVNSKEGTSIPISMGESVSVFVTRSYFGMRLPVYVGGLDLSWIHNAFFFFIGLLTIVFVFIEIKRWRNDRIGLEIIS